MFYNGTNIYWRKKNKKACNFGTACTLENELAEIRPMNYASDFSK